MGNRKYRKRNYALAALAVVLLLGLTHCQSHSDASAVKITNPEAASQPVTATPSTMTWQTAIARVAEQNIPAVVHIEVTQRREISNPMLPFNNDPFFHFFFNGPQMPRKFKQELRGLGTGMVIEVSRDAGRRAWTTAGKGPSVRWYWVRRHGVRRNWEWRARRDSNP